MIVESDCILNAVTPSRHWLSTAALIADVLVLAEEGHAVESEECFETHSSGI